MLCVFYAFIKELVSHLFWENWELIAEVSARTFSQDGAIAVPPRPSGALVSSEDAAIRQPGSQARRMALANRYFLVNF